MFYLVVENYLTCLLHFSTMATEKLKNYLRTCDRCNEIFRTISKSSRICYKCSKYKFKSKAVPKNDKDKSECMG